MIELQSLPAFTDNYIWMVHDGREAAVVDPGDAEVVRRALAAQGLVLRAILVTHHHPDHTGGVQGLRDLLQGPVYAPAREATPEPRVPVTPNSRLEVLGLPVQVLDVPGHTAGHVAYVMEPPGQSPLLFCGDTLFSGGCGRLFEGTPAQMHASLQALSALPTDTRVCCAHEYTLSNLRFALAVEPDNLEISTFHRECQSLRDRGQPTLPARLSRELAINPFLRTRHPAVRAMAEQQAGHALLTADAVLGQLREWKNRF